MEFVRLCPAMPYNSALAIATAPNPASADTRVLSSWVNGWPGAGKPEWRHGNAKYEKGPRSELRRGILSEMGSAVDAHGNALARGNRARRNLNRRPQFVLLEARSDGQRQLWRIGRDGLQIATASPAAQTRALPGNGAARTVGRRCFPSLPLYPADRAEPSLPPPECSPGAVPREKAGSAVDASSAVPSCAARIVTLAMASSSNPLSGSFFRNAIAPTTSPETSSGTARAACARDAPIHG